MMRYKVSIRYYDFIFDNSEEAIVFANQAKRHYHKDDDEATIDVTITLITEDDEKEDK